MAEGQWPRKVAAHLDPIWDGLRADAETTARDEPALASFLHATVLAHDTLEHALAYHLSQKLGSESITGLSLRQTIDQAVHGAADIGQLVRADLSAVFDRDPAARSTWEVVTCYPGCHARLFHRVAHRLWGWGLKWLARFVSYSAR